jgi:hypothetical protein
MHTINAFFNYTINEVTVFIFIENNEKPEVCKKGSEQELQLSAMYVDRSFTSADHF